MKSATRNGHTRTNAQVEALLHTDTPEAPACNAAAAVTALARGYAAELAKRVREGRLPYSLEQYMEGIGDQVGEQVKAIGVPDWVPESK